MDTAGLDSRIVVIDPARYLPETDCFNALIHRSPIKMTYHLPGMFGQQSLLRENLDGKNIKGVIVLGSAASVYDNQPWQNSLETWLRPLIESGVPTLGICYGHQMLARMFGGEVAYLTQDHAKLKGLYCVQFADSKVWKKGTRTLVRSHCEHVVKSPDCFTVIASSDDVRIDAIQHKNLPVWGIQTHPEATVAFLKDHEIALPQNPEEKLGDGLRLMKDFINFAVMK